MGAFSVEMLASQDGKKLISLRKVVTWDGTPGKDLNATKVAPVAELVRRIWPL